MVQALPLFPAMGTLHDDADQQLDRASYRAGTPDARVHGRFVAPVPVRVCLAL